MTEIPVRHLQAVDGTAGGEVDRAFSDALIRDAARARVRAERAEARADKAEAELAKARQVATRLRVLAQAMLTALDGATTADHRGPRDVW